MNEEMSFPSTPDANLPGVEMNSDQKKIDAVKKLIGKLGGSVPTPAPQPTPPVKPS